MEITLQLLLEGAMLGTFYAFMSAGFSLMWGVLGILNLAYGTLIVIGSYLSYTLFSLAGIDPLLSMPISLSVGVLVGVALQKTLINRVMSFEPFMILILTFGLDILLSHTLNLIFKADIRSIDVGYAEESLIVGAFILSYVKIIVFFLSLILIALLWALLHKTWTGKAIRAVALDREGAQLVGIDPSRIFLITSALGTGIAFASGNLYATLQGFTPFDGGILTIKAFLVSIIGGLGRVESALAGGIFLGMVEVFVSFYAGEEWKVFASLLLMLVFLTIRPRGLFGGKYYGEV